MESLVTPYKLGTLKVLNPRTGSWGALPADKHAHLCLAPLHYWWGGGGGLGMQFFDVAI